MSKRTQPAVVQALVDGSVIDPPAPYFVGVKTKGYRLTKQMLQQGCKSIQLHDRQLIKRIQRERERLQREKTSLWLPIHYDLEDSQQGLSILPRLTYCWTAWPLRRNSASGFSWKTSCACTLKFTVGRTGRCFNGITGLKRDLRKIVYLDGETIGGATFDAHNPAYWRLSSGLALA